MAILFFHHSFSYQKIYETTAGGRVWLAGASTPWIYTNSYGTLKSNSFDLPVSQALGIDRRTVSRYRQWAVQHNLLSDPLPPIEELHSLIAQTLQPGCVKSRFSNN